MLYKKRQQKKCNLLSLLKQRIQILSFFEVDSSLDSYRVLSSTHLHVALYFLYACGVKVTVSRSNVILKNDKKNLKINQKVFEKNE